RRLPGSGGRSRADRPQASGAARAALARRRGSHRRTRRGARVGRADRPPGRKLQRRRAPPARDRAGARVAAARAVPRRADGRARGPRGLAGDAGFAVGSTLTVPLHDRAGGEAIAAVGDLGLAAMSIGTREPTLDDVYLRLTGGRLAEAA